MAEQQILDTFFTGIPNENKMPHIHCITTRKMTVLQSPDLFKYCKVDKTTLNSIFSEDDQTPIENQQLSKLQQELNDSGQKLLAIFKLILKNDKVASSYLLYNLLSKVYNRSPEGMPLGHMNINLSGLTSEQAAQLQTFLSQVLAFQLNIKVSTQSLSEMRFQPRKNYDTNQMEPGLF